MENVTEMSGRAEAYYVMTNRWEADLEFFKIETTFLHQLQQEYFIRLSNQAEIIKLADIGHELSRIQFDMNLANIQCKEQLGQLVAIAENLVPENIKSLGDKNTALAHLMSRVTSEYHEVKKKLFLLVEGVMSYAS